MEADIPGDQEPAGRLSGCGGADGACGAEWDERARAGIGPRCLDLRPALVAASVVDSSGSIHGGSVWLHKGDKISWLAELVAAHGSGMTHAAFAIYDANLHLVAQTADKPSAFQTAGTDSWVKLSLTSRYMVPVSGRYYLVDLLAGSNLPRVGVVARSASVLAGASVLPTGIPRGISAGSALSAFPSTLTDKGSGLSRCILAG